MSVEVEWGRWGGLWRLVRDGCHLRLGGRVDKVFAGLLGIVEGSVRLDLRGLDDVGRTRRFRLS
jgi:hypothetical protein